VIDVSIPALPRPVVEVPLPGNASGIRIVDGHAVIAAGSGGLHILDLDVPASPVPVGDIDTPGYAGYVFVCGTTAYIAEFTAGIQVVDIRDFSRPRLTGALNTSNNALGVTADERFLFATDDRDGLIITRAQCDGR
jgi:hypothetical protein